MASPLDMPGRRPAAITSTPSAPSPRRQEFEGGYRPSHHLMKKARSQNIDLVPVLRAANDPSHTYPNLGRPGQFRHVRDGVVAVVDPTVKHVITTYKDQVETPIRQDQRGDRRAQAFEHSRTQR